MNLPTLANFCAIEQIFIVLNSQVLKKYQPIWSHWLAAKTGRTIFFFLPRIVVGLNAHLWNPFRWIFCKMKKVVIEVHWGGTSSHRKVFHRQIEIGNNENSIRLFLIKPHLTAMRHLSNSFTNISFVLSLTFWPLVELSQLRLMLFEKERTTII